MKPSQLKAFLAIVDHGSIRRAAKSLFVSQPSVTRLLRELEKDLGVDLVVRSTTGVKLTVYGEALQARARLLTQETRRARDEIEQIKSGLSGAVHLGVSAVAALTVLPKAFALFRQKMPRVELHCMDGLPPVALPELRHGRLDFVLTDLSPEQIDDDLTCEIILRTPQVVGAREGHPLRRKRSLAMLRNSEWVAWDKHQLELAFKRHGLPPPEQVVQIQSFVAAVGLVSETDTLSLFSLATMQPYLTRLGLKLIPVADTLPEALVSVVMRKDAVLTPAASALLDQVRKVAADVQAQLTARKRKDQEI